LHLCGLDWRVSRKNPDDSSAVAIVLQRKRLIPEVTRHQQLRKGRCGSIPSRLTIFSSALSDGAK
jgi:hypothetical protein